MRTSSINILSGTYNKVELAEALYKEAGIMTVHALGVALGQENIQGETLDVDAVNDFLKSVDEKLYRKITATVVAVFITGEAVS